MAAAKAILRHGLEDLWRTWNDLDRSWSMICLEKKAYEAISQSLFDVDLFSVRGYIHDFKGLMMMINGDRW